MISKPKKKKDSFPGKDLANESPGILCYYVCAKLLQSCPTICDPIDDSLPGSPVHGILQARVLEWVAISFSKRSSQSRDQNPHLLDFVHWQAGSSLVVPLGKPMFTKALPNSFSSL